MPLISLPGWHTGAALARQLGVSRTRVERAAYTNQTIKGHRVQATRVMYRTYFRALRLEAGEARPKRGRPALDKPTSKQLARALVKHGGVAGAARELGVSESTVRRWQAQEAT